MKKNLFSYLGILFCSCIIAQNPISPPGVYIADPSAKVFPDGKLYIYGSLDISPDYYCSNSYHVMATDNMKDWDLYMSVFSSKGLKDEVKYSDAILYAPDAQFYNGRYYLYYCLSNDKPVEGVATSDSPVGPFVNGEPLLGPKQIDPTVFVDDDGQAYYYWGQFAATVAKLKRNMKEIDSASVTKKLLTAKEHYFHEGSYMFKRKGIYYLVYTQINNRGLATSIGYSTSKSPLGPFKYGGVVIDNFGCDPNSWNNHGSIQEFKGKWYVFYHRSTHGSNSMRKACVEPITFLSDGSIPQVEMTSQGAADPFDPFQKIDAARACLLTGKVRVVRSGEHSEELAKIENGNVATYKYFNFTKMPTKIKFKICSEAGGRVTLFTNSLCPPFNASLEIEPGDGKTYKEYTVNVSGIILGVQPLFLKFTGEEDKSLFRIDSFRFEQ